MGAPSFISVKYGTQQCHSSLLTSLEYAVRSLVIPTVMRLCIYNVQTFLRKSAAKALALNWKARLLLISFLRNTRWSVFLSR